MAITSNRFWATIFVVLHFFIIQTYSIKLFTYPQFYSGSEEDVSNRPSMVVNYKEAGSGDTLTLTIKPEPLESHDCHINIGRNATSSSWENSNNGQGTTFQVGSYDFNTVLRGLIKFDLPTELSNKEILNATIFLHTKQWRLKDTTGLYPIDVHQILRPWKAGIGKGAASNPPDWNSPTIDGATGLERFWGDQDGSEDWNVPGMGRDDVDAGKMIVCRVWKDAYDMIPWEFEITELCKQWNDAVTENYGVLLRCPYDNGVDEVNIGMKRKFTEQGAEVWLPIYITNYEAGVALSAIEFSLNIDPSVVEYVEATGDSGLANEWMIEINSVRPDLITITMDGIGKEIEYGEGELIRCKLRIKPGAENGISTNLFFSDVKINEGKIVPTTTDGKIILDNVPVIYGDVSGNMEVTAYDGAGIVQYALGVLDLPDSNFPNFTHIVADVSGDDSITSYDAALVFQYSVGLLEKFPVEVNKVNFSRIDTSFENAAMSLVSEINIPDNMVTYSLFCENIKGAISADIFLKYNPNNLLIEQGQGAIVTGLYAQLESVVDKENDIMQISITTTDDFEKNEIFEMLSLKAKVADTSAIASSLLFISATVDEVDVKKLNPSINTENVQTNYTNNVTPLFYSIPGSIVLSNLRKQPISVSIFNVQGKLILRKHFLKSRNKVIVNTSSLASGIYFCAIAQGKEIKKGQFIITH